MKLTGTALEFWFSPCSICSGAVERSCSAAVCIREPVHVEAPVVSAGAKTVRASVSVRLRFNEKFPSDSFAWLTNCNVGGPQFIGSVDAPAMPSSAATSHTFAKKGVDR